MKEFESYKGAMPAPSDFNEYWDRALSEMNAVKKNVSIVEAAFQCPGAKCYDLYFDGVGGARIHAKYIHPEKPEGKIPAVLTFHGYTGNSGNWFNKLGFVLSGYAVFTLDCRGQSGTSEDTLSTIGTTFNGHIIRGLSDENPDKMMFRNVYLDAAELAQIAIETDIVDENRVYVKGGSQGGALATVCAALEPRIKKAAIAYPFLSDFKKIAELGMRESYAEIKEYFRRYDPCHEKEDWIFNKLGYIDVKNFAPKVKAETLMFTGLSDTCCPPITQYAVYNNLTCKKKHILYPDFGHEELPGADDIVLGFLNA